MSSDLAFRSVTLPTLTNPSADQHEASARTRGFAAGYAAGIRAAQQDLLERQTEREHAHAEMLREGRAAVDSTLAVLTSAVHATQALVLPVLTDAEDVLAASALELAESLLGHELSRGDLSARSALERVLRSDPPTDITSIRLNPDDLASLDEASRERAAAPLVADPGLKRGDALAMLPDGFIDARIDAALNRARAALLGSES